MKRERVTAYIRKDLVEWLEKKTEEGRFRSKSHGVEESVQRMRIYLREESPNPF